MPEYEALVKELIDGEMELLELTDWELEKQLPEERAGQILSNILRAPVETAVVRKLPVHRRIARQWAWRAAAVLFILASGLGGYRFLSDRHQETIAALPSGAHDVAPGTNKAVLTLAGGTIIVLDSAHSGRLTRQGGAGVIKLDNGRLAYTTLNEKPDVVVYNTLTTPRGGQYQLTLQDGSRVWLDAASSIKYPTTFSGDTREVEITGEAYFEIADNPRMPFVVKTGGTKTTVLGTHFNIDAYEDEKTLIITLLEGTVKFACGKEEKILRPGQQAALDASTRSFTLQKADTYQAVAWKNGQFDFDNKDLPAIMRQISRWYDVDITYQSTYSGAKFGGGISRQLNLSHVLQLLDKSGVHTRLDNRQLIILP
jgi:ferric-dicitrate binding protein FerR (iron transport regulator)